MKRLFVFVPAILLALFLLNSFVVTEKEVKKTERAKSSTGLALRDNAPIDSFKKVPVAKVNILYKSNDGGQTWQDISQGLPEIEQPVKFSTGASDLYLHVKNVMYRSKSDHKAPVWEKADFPDLQNASSMLESEGVLIATGTKGIMRSTDNGEHWKWVIKEGGVGIAVEHIEGGFAAIVYNTTTKTRRVHISLDNGKTWEVISDTLGPSASISSIKQMGKYLICGHPAGIFRSSDMGKTWNSVHSSVDKVENKDFKYVLPWNSPSEPKNVFKIFVSGEVLYALAVSAGC
jgi:photosystem II stability/assembly factor-like uncharacterized protein